MSIDTSQTTKTTAATAQPKPGRRGSAKYPPTVPEAVLGCIAYFNEAVAHLKDPEANPPADIEHLRRGLPQGSITEVVTEQWAQGTVVGWRIGERNLRYSPATGLLILRSLSLFGGVPYLDTNQKGGRELHYVEIMAQGYTLQRLMAGAEPGEAVRLIGDHHDLCPWSLLIEPNNPRAMRDRRGIIRLALARYDKAAVLWGLSDLISRDSYEQLLRGAFRLFDAEHGKHLLRPLKATA